MIISHISLTFDHDLILFTAHVIDALLSVTTGNYPTSLMCTTISRSYKSADKDSVSNYRSAVVVINKILKKCIENGILSTDPTVGSWQNFVSSKAGWNKF